jgi:hypothetical protein
MNTTVDSKRYGIRRQQLRNRPLRPLHRPVSFGNATALERSPSPIHSSISSVIADTSTGSQPIPSIYSIRFFRQTIPKT